MSCSRPRITTIFARCLHLCGRVKRRHRLAVTKPQWPAQAVAQLGRRVDGEGRDICAAGRSKTLGRTRLTHPPDFRQTYAVVVAWRAATRAILLDRDRAQTRLVQIKRRAQ